MSVVLERRFFLPTTMALPFFDATSTAFPELPRFIHLRISIIPADFKNQRANDPRLCGSGKRYQ